MSFLNAMFPVREPFQCRPLEDMVVPKRDKSQHNTLRHDQVERRRKQRKRAGRKPNKPYVKVYA